MELLPEDPKKRKITIGVLGVIGLVAVVVIVMQVLGGDSVPSDPVKAAEQAAVDAGQAPPEPKGTGHQGGARVFNPQ
ncbi:MAG: hypothetical protein SFY69_00180 [Planctomycetota bacterium]|nr:hypothetical protein [Planctomycetota bacterium]